MNNEIKEILAYFEKYVKITDMHDSEPMLNWKDLKIVLDYITNLQQENERLKEKNNDLRKIYRNTYNRLFEKGNDELARYFQAQIDDCPTFYVEPIIDYHKEWLDYKSRIEKAVEYIENTPLYETTYDYNMEEELEIQNVSDETASNKLLNILRGDKNGFNE